MRRAHEPDEDDSLNEILEQDDSGDLGKVPNVEVASANSNQDDFSGSYDDDDKASDDSSSTTSSGDDSESYDDESQAIDDDDDDDSWTKDNLCFRLASSDASLSELTLDVAVVGKMAKDIKDALSHNSRLEKLCIVGNQQEANQRNFEILLGAIAGNCSVTTFKVHNAALDRNTAKILGNALARNKTLSRLCLSNCTFEGSALAVLFIGMQHNKSIKELAVRGCDLSGPDCDIVATSLSLLRLKTVALVGTSIHYNGLQFFLENVLEAKSITELNLSQNELGLAGIKLLTTCLKSSNQNVEKLILSSCGLDHSCIRILSTGLLKNPSLQRIDLSGNKFGDQGAGSLKGLLETNNSIVELDVGGCKIGKRKLKLIADGLRYNNSFLKSLFPEQLSLAILESVDLISESGNKRNSR